MVKLTVKLTVKIGAEGRKTKTYRFNPEKVTEYNGSLVENLLGFKGFEAMPDEQLWAPRTLWSIVGSLYPMVWDSHSRSRAGAYFMECHKRGLIGDTVAFDYYGVRDQVPE